MVYLEFSFGGVAINILENVAVPTSQQLKQPPAEFLQDEMEDHLYDLGINESDEKAEYDGISFGSVV